jgi:hypothetical protein
MGGGGLTTITLSYGFIISLYRKSEKSKEDRSGG